MFRRRPIRRMLRPARGRLRAERRAFQELVLANQMMESGNYTGAAEQFETLARVAEARGGRRAPQFYLQAGRARILAGENEAGLIHLKHGLSLLVHRAEWLRLHRAGRRILTELNQRGLTAAAEEISSFMSSNLPGNFSISDKASPTRKPVLPTHCLSCGAALHPDEVEWLDEVTAECAYCGSPVREES
jgi:hypothetical protein